MGLEQNLIAGPLTLYIGPQGEALPEINDLAPPSITIGAVGGNWVAIGFSVDDEDFDFVFSPTFQRVRVNEETSTLKHVLLTEEGSLTLMLAEKDLQAFSEAIATAAKATVAAAANQVGQDTVFVGGTAISVKSLLLIGTSPEGGSRIIQVHKAVQVEDASFSHGRQHKGIPVKWEFEGDSTQSVGEKLFKIWDNTTQATS